MTKKKVHIKTKLLIVYIVLLFVFVILKLYSQITFFTREHILRDRSIGIWNYNFILFKTIGGMIRDNNYINILGNLIPFVPLGFLIAINEQKRNPILSMLKCFIMILFFEFVQFITCFGFFDIDDIFLNIVACIVGIITYYSIFGLYNHTKK